MKLYAISDLHLEADVTQVALETMPFFPEDWLILAGDIGNTERILTIALKGLTPRFKQVIWVPGNHDLWREKQGDPAKASGEAKYLQLVALCREFGVLTPEDPYPIWPLDDKVVIVPVFLLYDYTFRPDYLTKQEAMQEALEEHSVCADEYLLNPAPYVSREAWCQSRIHYTEQRLAKIPFDKSLIVINHYPLHQRLVRLHRIPKFSIWCGTRATENWPNRFPITTVVYGHLHMRTTDYINGVRHEEVSLGYPRHWEQSKGIEGYLRQILPAPEFTQPNLGPIWHYP